MDKPEEYLKRNAPFGIYIPNQNLHKAMKEFGSDMSLTFLQWIEDNRDTYPGKTNEEYLEIFKASIEL